MDREFDQERGALMRTIDATMNRLGEALRTIEDQLRFGRSLPSLPERWKVLRHRLAALRSALEDRSGATALWRDVAGDRGAELPRSSHASAADLLRANLARARESVRSLEECLRSGWAELSAEANALRYGIYEAEGATVGLLHRRDRLAEARLYVLLTTALAARPILETAALTLAGGADMIQLREKELSDGDVLALARDLRELTAASGARLIINDRVDIAALAGADGVHLGQDDLCPREARRILGPTAIVGVSTHSVEQAERAVADGADYIGVGPIFPTRTKEHRRAVGLGAIASARAVAPVPRFAIGSVNRDTLEAVVQAGATRVAVCTGIIASENIEETTVWFRERLAAGVSSRLPADS